MASWGKWILGGLGWAVGGPIGALVGVFIGSLFSSSQPNKPSSGTSNSGGTRSTHHTKRTTQGDISASIIVLMACVIKADGRVLKSEIAYIKPFLVQNFGQEGAKQALQLLKQLLDQPINPAEVAQQIAMYVNYSVRLELVHLLLEIAKSDGDVADYPVDCQSYGHLICRLPVFACYLPKAYRRKLGIQGTRDRAFCYQRRGQESISPYGYEVSS